MKGVVGVRVGVGGMGGMGVPPYSVHRRFACYPYHVSVTVTGAGQVPVSQVQVDTEKARPFRVAN